MIQRSKTTYQANCRKPYIALALLFVAMVVCINQASAAETQPNVLLIMTDDQGYGDFSLHGNPHLKTPHVDQLAREGVRFERFYVNSFCAPTRAALLTGRYPLRCGVFGVTHNKEAMRTNETTLAEALKTAGYRTACIGKWHNGEQYPYTPPGQGFDEFFGFHNGHINNYFDSILLRGTQPEKTHGYISDVLTDDAIRFMTAHQSQPFFCYLSYNAPHSPYQIPDSYYDKFRAKGFDERVSGFYGMCENIDDNVGRLLAKLDDLNLSQKTIVIFLTDNGGTAGVKIYNAGMRGGKTSVHEGGCRVPLFVRWPEKLLVGYTVKRIASHIDVYPTVLDLCGVKPPAGLPIDGISLKPFLLGDSRVWPERLLFTHNPISATNRYPGAVRTQRYRLVREIRGRQGGSSAVQNDRSAPPWQLYDMQADPSEKKNIAKDHPQLVKKLSEQYEAWVEDTRKPGLKRLPIPVGYPQEHRVVLNAPQAFLKGNLRFDHGPGFAHDWITGWSDEEAVVSYEIDVVHAGTYQLAMQYATTQENPLTLEIAGESVTLRSQTAAVIPLQHRDQRSRERYVNRNWKTVPLTKVDLKTGPKTITLKLRDVPEGQSLDFKALILEPVQRSED